MRQAERGRRPSECSFSTPSRPRIGVSLLTVIGAQRQNAALAVAALAVLAISNIVLAPLYGVLGAAIAVAIATFFWLVACAVVLGRVSGLRTDALYLLGRSLSPRSASA